MKYLLAIFFSLVLVAPAEAATTITITSPRAGANYAVNENVLASYSCASTRRNRTIRSCSGPVANGSPISTATAGSKSFTVTAVDSNNQTASKTVTYTVTSSGGGGICAGYVSLTYDDGPTTMTRQYVDTLKSLGVRATFFDVGNNMNARPSDVQYTVANGMPVENHSMTHTDLTSISDDAKLGNEIAGPKSIASILTGWQETILRPPYGYSNARVFDAIEANGMREVTWSIDTNDWQNPSSSTIVSRVSAMHDQDIILMHDGYPNTLNAMAGVVNTMKSKGLCAGKIVPSWDTTIFNPWGWPVYAQVVSF